MRRLIAAAPLMFVLASGCRMKRAHHAVMQDDGQLMSVVNAADARGAIQLTRGFHGIEANSWRWTMKNFSVTLRPPSGAAQSGARLQLRFAVPETMFNRVGDMTVAARIDGADLGSQTYSKPGEAVYERDVPASELASDAVSFDFTVDKGLPPSDQDPRELSLVVTSIGLVPK